MAIEWYCKIGQQIAGPMSAQQLRHLATSGKLKPTDAVRKSTMSEWVSANQIKGLFHPQPSPVSAPAQNAEPDSAKHTCPSCQATLTPTTVFCIACGLDLRTGHKRLAAISRRSPKRRFWIVAASAAILGVAVGVLLYVFVVRPVYQPPLASPRRIASGTTNNPSHPPGAASQVQTGKSTTRESAVGHAAAGAPSTAGAAVLPVPHPAVGQLMSVVTDRPLAEAMVRMRGQSEIDVLLILADRNGKLLVAVESVAQGDCVNQAIPLLVATIQETRTSDDPVPQMFCANAIWALGRMGPAAGSAVPAITELVSHPDPFVAGEARESLSRIGGAPVSPVMTPASHGVLGDSLDRLKQCYGDPIADEESSELRETRMYTFRSDQLTIRALIADGVCGDLHYIAQEGTTLDPGLVDELLQANAPQGLQWQSLEIGDTMGNPKWMCQGQANDGSSISRFAMRPREELIVVDLQFKDRYKK